MDPSGSEVPPVNSLPQGRNYSHALIFFSSSSNGVAHRSFPKYFLNNDTNWSLSVNHPLV